MNLKSLIVSSAISLFAVANSASAQWVGTSIGFGGSYSNTTFSGSCGNGSITTTSIGASIGVGYGNGYYGGCGPYYGGVVVPTVMPYYGCVPNYVPYNVYCPPVYAPPVVVAPYYGGGYWRGGYGGCGRR